MQIAPSTGQSPAVSAAPASTPMSMTSPPPAPALNGTLSGIAKQLGMNVANVQSALKQGSSIADLAAQQGVSTSAIVQSVQAQIQQTRQAAGQAPLDQTTLDRMVNRAVTHHHHRGAGAAIAALASGPSMGSDTRTSSYTSSSSSSSFSTFA